MDVIPYPILNEQEVVTFNFYMGGRIQKGIQHDEALYGLAYASEYHDLAVACALAQQLVKSGSSVVLTIGENHKVWVCLNAAEYPHYQAFKEASTAGGCKDSNTTPQELPREILSSFVRSFPSTIAKTNPKLASK